MDIFSFLPIIIFIYAIATIFNPGNRKRGSNRQSPFPPPGTWKEKIEKMESQWFPQENPERKRNPQSLKSTRIESQPGWARARSAETSPRNENFGTEGYSRTDDIGSEEGVSGGEGSSIGTEGTWGIEGTLGTEGTSGSEGTLGTEGSFGIDRFKISQGIPTRRGTDNQSNQADKSSDFPSVSEGSLVQGVIWAEVLGKPRARNGWSYTRRH